MAPQPARKVLDLREGIEAKKPDNGRHEKQRRVDRCPLPISDRCCMHAHFSRSLSLGKAQVEPTAANEVSQSLDFFRVRGGWRFCRRERRTAERQRWNARADFSTTARASAIARSR